MIGSIYGSAHFVIAGAVGVGLHVSLFSCRETGSQSFTPAIWHESLTVAFQLQPRCTGSTVKRCAPISCQVCVNFARLRRSELTGHVSQRIPSCTWQKYRKNTTATPKWTNILCTEHFIHFTYNACSPERHLRMEANASLAFSVYKMKQWLNKTTPLPYLRFICKPWYRGKVPFINIYIKTVTPNSCSKLHGDIKTSLKHCCLLSLIIF